MTLTETQAIRRAFDISDITPDDVIELGYNLFLSDHAPEETLRLRAGEVVREFDALVAELNGSMNEAQRLYMMRVKMAANDLARGIARRKDDRNQSLKGAQEKFEKMIARMAQTERASGILQGGLRLCLLGGVTYIIMYLFFGSNTLAAQKFAEHKELTALAIALGSTLVGSYFKAWWMNKQVRKVYEDFERERREIQGVYAEAAKQEYNFAHGYASEGYKCLTGREPPLNAGFRNMLLDLMREPNAVPFVPPISA